MFPTDTTPTTTSNPRPDRHVEPVPQTASVVATASNLVDSAYVVVPQYGSPEDTTDPLSWVRLVESAVTML